MVGDELPSSVEGLQPGRSRRYGNLLFFQDSAKTCGVPSKKSSEHPGHCASVVVFSNQADFDFGEIWRCLSVRSNVF
jgi:hypothetical protein